ncbi:amiloride-sensitive sodium channel subunit gamma-like, partial [Anneissia japonica]|uniref:amiloride-sensitive sodium channel subunit gamma-like n=1 Tax=Anneissia japonica TaxID=1529436 RepID=UPI001425518D
MTIIQELTGAKKDNENGTNVALVVGSSMENISAHGIPNIKRAQTQTRRLLWVCAFLVSFSVCVWQIVSLLNAYYARQITTNMDIKSVTSLVFPAITICNMNGMRYSYIKTQSELNKSLTTIALKERNKYQDWGDTNLENHEIYFDMINVVTEHAAALPYKDREITGHNLSEAMLSCTFNGYPCLPSNFTYNYNYLYGNCYTFNDGKNFPVVNSTRAGPLYGLTLEMDIKQNDYIEDIQPAAGLKIVVHDQTEMPFPEDQGVTVTPGTETSIAIYK